MKQILAIFLIGLLAGKALGQQSVDIGIFGGAGTYFGDMTRVDFQKSVNPAYGGFVRFNFNPRYALRFNVINGTIGAEGDIISKPWSFNKNVLDISMNFEFNYLKYIVGDKETNWSTFIFGGLGMQSYGYNIITLDGAIDGSEISPVIPFGMGFKFDLSKRFGIGLEGGLRKSFSDKLDNLDDPLSYVTQENVQIKYTDDWHNNDWTAYFGIHLVYKLIYGNRMWELATPRKHLLDWGIWNNNRKE
jgi:hypothetical protein